jgi:hypothetical protein
MIAARALACALILAGCGAGDTIVLGGGITGGAAAASGGNGGGGGAGGGQAGSGGSIVQDAGATPPIDASDAADPVDAGPDGSIEDVCLAAVTTAVTTCTRPPSRDLIDFTELFVWPASPPTAPRPTLMATSIPLVANFTDDNSDGRVDLCDTPDVLVLALDDNGDGLLHLISGDTGQLHHTLPTFVASNVTPALADLDRDGDIEIVTISPAGQLLVLDAAGNVLIEGGRPTLWGAVATSCIAIAIADLDGDDRAEIIAGYDVFDRQGSLLFTYGGDRVMLEMTEQVCVAPLAADVQGSGELEVIFSPPAIHGARGELYSQLTSWGQPRVVKTGLGGLPELLVVDGPSINIIHEGGSSTVIQDLCVTSLLTAIEVDGDDVLEVVFASCALRLVELADQSVIVPRWQNEFSGASGLLTAFDFLGDGIADVVHATGNGLAVHDGQSGGVLFERAALQNDSFFGGPVVADVNNDGSADLLMIVSTEDGPTLLALSSATSSFAPARRFYNQYANQVTHFDELGRSVALPPPFRVSHQNAQIENGRICIARQ